MSADAASANASADGNARLAAKKTTAPALAKRDPIRGRHRPVSSSASAATYDAADQPARKVTSAVSAATP